MLKTLQWLLVYHRVKSKILIIVYKALHNLPSPHYIFDLLSFLLRSWSSPSVLLLFKPHRQALALQPLLFFFCLECSSPDASLAAYSHHLIQHHTPIPLCFSPSWHLTSTNIYCITSNCLSPPHLPFPTPTVWTKISVLCSLMNYKIPHWCLSHRTQ